MEPRLGFLVADDEQHVGVVSGQERAYGVLNSPLPAIRQGSDHS
jgi:hypothetical protein